MNEIIETASQAPNWPIGLLLIVLGGFAAYWLNRKRKSNLRGGAAKPGGSDQKRY